MILCIKSTEIIYERLVYMAEKCRYPLVFVHGMFGWGSDEGINDKLPYWGATTGDLMEFLNDNGYEAYSASCGPVSSAWDRACEVYARIMGTTVDYGKVHSKNANHRRFGRTYDEPLFEGWSSEKKIHLIGHSFGGNTVRMLAYLLTYGSKAEQDETKPDELSPLFEGGHEDLLQSVVTICAPHNGTTTFQAAEKFKIMNPLAFVAYNYIGIMGRTRAEGSIFDFHLEQYGLSDTPGKKDAYPMRRAKKQMMVNNDNVQYDMSPIGAKRFNHMLEISPNTYYFSYAYNAVTESRSGKLHYPSRTDFPFLAFTASLVLVYNRFTDPQNNKSFSGYANDGLVNLNSAIHPEDEPFKDYDENDIQPGIWNVMPVRTGDHGTPIGLFADKEQTHDFYLVMLQTLAETEELSAKRKSVPAKKPAPRKRAAKKAAPKSEEK